MRKLLQSLAGAFGLSLLAASLMAADAEGDFRLVSMKDAEQYALSNVYFQTTPATMYVWADRVSYRPNNSATVRWTLNPNGDFYPYTVFVYRTHNNTGNRTFYGSSGASGTPVDFFGRDAAAGYQPTVLPTFNKRVFAGEGGFVPAVTIPDEPGMHTLTVELRDYLGGRVIKAAHFKFGVSANEEVIEGNITADRTLSNTTVYRLRGNVFVQDGATLTIPAGTVILGEPGSAPTSYLTVTNSSRLIARGTKSMPIIFTSTQPVGQRSRGDWGGLVLLGQAPINLAGGSALAEGQVNDDRVRYGGSNANHSCGELEYLRVEFAGARFSQTNELNGIAFHGCGRGTITRYVQSHYGADDAIEWFGGTNDAKYLIATYSGDDLLDWTYGYSGRVQFAIGVLGSDPGGNGIEADNNDQTFNATPTSTPQIYNMTLLGGAKDDSSRGARLRAGTAGRINNSIIQGWTDEGIRIETSESLANVDGGTLTGNSIILWRNEEGQTTISGQTDATTLPILQGTRGQFRNVVATDPMLTDTTRLSDINLMPLPDSPAWRVGTAVAPGDGFFDQSTTFIGAMGSDDWTEEWATFLLESDLRP